MTGVKYAEKGTVVSVAETRGHQASSDVAEVAETIMQQLELAWNRADGAAFGAPFSANADFVTIQGHHHVGRDAIAAGHQQIFDTIYAGSTIRYQLLQARQLDDQVILAHGRATLNAPGGPLAGLHSSTATVVLLSHGDEYEITAFHNTLITG
ncbi:MAG TPA: SgcJ/EcaC family oxidoreductase [Streptosporangiaceae bacterium]|nr:SgcJ/EcaC family oxidoreductase [Streptosporangiaceae bacterium]